MKFTFAAIVVGCTCIHYPNTALAQTPPPPPEYGVFMPACTRFSNNTLGCRLPKTKANVPGPNVAYESNDIVPSATLPVYAAADVIRLLQIRDTRLDVLDTKDANQQKVLESLKEDIVGAIDQAVKSQQSLTPEQLDSCGDARRSTPRVVR